LAIMPGIVAVHSPTLRTVSIMPGIDRRAPERQEINNGFPASPYFIPMIDSIFRSASRT